MSEKPIQPDLGYERFVDDMIQRIEALMLDMGAPSFEAGIRMGVSLFEWLAQSMKAVQSTADFRRVALTKMERPSPINQKMLRGCFDHLPRLVAHGATQLAANEVRGLPPLRGRKGKTIQEKIEVVDFIVAKIKIGYNTDQAKNRAARHFTMSRATVQRIWDDRASVGEVDYGSVLKWAVETFGVKPAVPGAGNISAS
jgi:hypothetical protein